VSHRLPEVFRLCDRITVLRDGAFVGTYDAPATEPSQIVRAMVGRDLLPRAADMAAMKSPEFIDKLRRGPVMILTVLPNGPFSMGKSLTQWFIYVVVVGILAAYVAGRTLAPGAEYLTVFRIASITAFIGYAVALWQMSIWYRRSWSTTFKATLDGLIYALLTGGAFGWLWPAQA